MFAVIALGGRQYTVAEGDTLLVDRVDTPIGQTLDITQVLLVHKDGVTTVGSPTVAKARVAADVVEHGRDRKIVVFKKRRRQNSRRRNGHRQDFSVVRIKSIAV